MTFSAFILLLTSPRFFRERPDFPEGPNFAENLNEENWTGGARVKTFIMYIRHWKHTGRARLIRTRLIQSST